MKLSRRLIPAFAMLLVSAVLMSTASFAWFTMNAEVTATGMTVNAEAESSLVIKGITNDTDDKDADFTNVGTNNVSELTLKPCTSWDGKTWGVLKNVAVENANSSQASWGDDGEFDPEELTKTELANHVAVSQYQLKNVGEDTAVYVKSVEVTTDGTNQMLGAVRVAIEMGNTVLVFAPNGSNLNDEGKVGKCTNATNDVWELSAITYKVAGKLEAKLGDLVADQVQQVNVYIWFEGQDANCRSEFAVDADNVEVNIKFTNLTPAN